MDLGLGHLLEGESRSHSRRSAQSRCPSPGPGLPQDLVLVLQEPEEPEGGLCPKPSLDHTVLEQERPGSVLVEVRFRPGYAGLDLN